MQPQKASRHQRWRLGGAAVATLGAAAGPGGLAVSSADAAELVEYLLRGLGLAGTSGVGPLDSLERLSVWLLEPDPASFALLGAGLWIAWRVLRRR